MEFDLYKIGEETAKLHGMTKEQSKGEVQYKMAHDIGKIGKINAFALALKTQLKIELVNKYEAEFLGQHLRPTNSAFFQKTY